MKLIDLNTILITEFNRQVFDLEEFKTETKVISYKDSNLELETIVTIYGETTKVLSKATNVNKEDLEELELYDFIDITDKDVFQIDVTDETKDKALWYFSYQCLAI